MSAASGSAREDLIVEDVFVECKVLYIVIFATLLAAQGCPFTIWATTSW